MELILVDRNPVMCEAWHKAFQGVSNATILNTDFKSVPISDYDCVITPGNSFGIMDGGFDGVVVSQLGNHVQRDVKDYILQNHAGYMPVGCSGIIDIKTHYLVYAPTMRYPKKIDNPQTIFDVMWSALSAITTYRFNFLNMSDGWDAQNTIKRVICPGLGSATGRLAAGDVAHYMAMAYSQRFALNGAVSWDRAMKFSHEIEGK